MQTVTISKEFSGCVNWLSSISTRKGKITGAGWTINRDDAMQVQEVLSEVVARALASMAHDADHKINVNY